MSKKSACIKRVFPGNNTPLGFYSFYHEILPPDATRVFVIKGGPGVGKSTFMQNIARDLFAMGFDTEIHHCSSDNDSIDGVVFPELGVGVIDGTWPHVVDPRAPGVVDEIIWLGQFWDEEAMKPHKHDILALQKELETLFARAYRYLKAAQVVYEEWESINTKAMDFGKANLLAQRVIEENFSSMPVARRAGHKRHLFASAITPDGMVNYLDTIVGNCPRRYVVEGDPGTGKSYLLDKVATAAVERGLYVELYHCPLNPQKIEHVLVPEMGLALTKSIEPHTFVPGPNDTIVDMNQCLDMDLVEKHYPAVIRASESFSSLFQTAIHWIREAKSRHDALERYYTPHVDFDGIDGLRRKIVEKILDYAKQNGVLKGT